MNAFPWDGTPSWRTGGFRGVQSMSTTSASKWNCNEPSYWATQQQKRLCLLTCCPRRLKQKHIYIWQGERDEPLYEKVLNCLQREASYRGPSTLQYWDNLEAFENSQRLSCTRPKNAPLTMMFSLSPKNTETQFRQGTEKVYSGFRQSLFLTEIGALE